jgi:thioredoxin 1
MGMCIPCKMMVPILESLKQEYAGKLVVEVIDLSHDQSPAEKYGIQSIPTQIIFDREGKEVFRHVGFWSKEDIVAKLKELGLLD